jgi:hypothetical protein
MEKSELNLKDPASINRWLDEVGIAVVNAHAGTFCTMVNMIVGNMLTPLELALALRLGEAVRTATVGGKELKAKQIELLSALPDEADDTAKLAAMKAASLELFEAAVLQAIGPSATIIDDFVITPSGVKINRPDEAATKGIPTNATTVVKPGVTKPVVVEAKKEAYIPDLVPGTVYTEDAGARYHVMGNSKWGMWFDTHTKKGWFTRDGQSFLASEGAAESNMLENTFGVAGVWINKVRRYADAIPAFE